MHTPHPVHLLIAALCGVVCVPGVCALQVVMLRESLEGGIDVQDNPCKVSAHQLAHTRSHIGRKWLGLEQPCLVSLELPYPTSCIIPSVRNPLTSH